MRIMITRLTMFLGVALFLTNCGQQTRTSDGQATIRANFKNAKGILFYLEDVNGTSAYALDTVIVETSKAIFSAEVQPGIYRVRAVSHPGNHYALLYLDNNSTLDLSLDLDHPKDYTISGDQENELLKKTLLRQDELAKIAKEYQKTLQSSTDKLERDSTNANWIKLVATATGDIKGSIEESRDMNPNLTAYFLNLLDPKSQVGYINKELKALSQQDADSRLIKRMVSHYAVKQPTSGNRGGVAIGATAPEIVQSSPDGKNIPLTSLRGNYVLIDFWASWCRPCRYENPNVVKTYHKYKDKGFDIYSVSLDKNRDRWAKAISDDGLVWESHVSDLQAWSNQAARDYGVGSIPATFLIDPEGKVIAKNLRGPALEEKLKELLGGV